MWCAQPRGGRTMSEALFIGVYPTGLVYADRRRERNGDYVRAAYLNYRTLNLEVAPDCPEGLLPNILAHARVIQQRIGEKFQIDQCGHTVVLGR